MLTNSSDESCWQTGEVCRPWWSEAEIGEDFLGSELKIQTGFTQSMPIDLWGQVLWLEKDLSCEAIGPVSVACLREFVWAGQCWRIPVIPAL